jgi:t-SNARE complex subunit (syntaxin)
MTTLETQTIREEINERIKLGVPIEAIIGDLKDRGIDMFELNQAEVALEYEENTNDIEKALFEIQTAKRKYNRALLGILICSVIIFITLSVNRISLLARFGKTPSNRLLSIA